MSGTEGLTSRKRRRWFAASVLASLLVAMGCGKTRPIEQELNPPPQPPAQCYEQDARELVDSDAFFHLNMVFTAVLPMLEREYRGQRGARFELLENICFTVDEQADVTHGSVRPGEHGDTVTVDISDVKNMQEPTIQAAAHAALDVQFLLHHDDVHAPIVPFESPISEHATLVTLDDVAGRIWTDVITWTIFHEVAHHYLDHAATPVSAEGSRAQELAADHLAVEWMRQLGLSIYYVAAYLRARSDTEEGDVARRRDTVERHPSWHTRWAAFVDEFPDFYVHPSRPMIIDMIFALRFPTPNGWQASVGNFTIVIPEWRDYGPVWVLDGEQPLTSELCTLRFEDDRGEGVSLHCRYETGGLQLTFGPFPSTVLAVSGTVYVAKTTANPGLYDGTPLTQEMLYHRLPVDGLLAFQSNTSNYAVISSGVRPGSGSFLDELIADFARVGWVGSEAEHAAREVLDAQRETLKVIHAYNLGELTRADFDQRLEQTTAGEDRVWSEVERTLGPQRWREYITDAIPARNIVEYYQYMGQFQDYTMEDVLDWTNDGKLNDETIERIP
jgi:hypothetical protein